MRAFSSTCSCESRSPGRRGATSPWAPGWASPACGSAGARGSTNERGFSLIELLVVITIIGLLSTIVVLTMADPRGRIGNDVDSFAGKLRAARDAAIISGRPTAVWVSQRAYGFERRENGQWQAVNEGPLASKDWSGETNARFSGVSQLRTVFDSVGRADQALDFQLVRDRQTMRVRVSLDGKVQTGE